MATRFVGSWISRRLVFFVSVKLDEVGVLWGKWTQSGRRSDWNWYSYLSAIDPLFASSFFGDYFAICFKVVVDHLWWWLQPLITIDFCQIWEAFKSGQELDSMDLDGMDIRPVRDSGAHFCWPWRNMRNSQTSKKPTEKSQKTASGKCKTASISI